MPTEQWEARRLEHVQHLMRAQRHSLERLVGDIARLGPPAPSLAAPSRADLAEGLALALATSEAIEACLQELGPQGGPAWAGLSVVAAHDGAAVAPVRHLSVLAAPPRPGPARPARPLGLRPARTPVPN